MSLESIYKNCFINIVIALLLPNFRSFILILFKVTFEFIIFLHDDLAKKNVMFKIVKLKL